ncbi:extensin-like [Hevea brasiliensis]|uniref:extensin-like n=1 Tax=Hevea brasiliensis TaxID=3981 RepID=UPI0025E2EE3A|nr:extensin-like [Hevea brasiliensis]
MYKSPEPSPAPYNPFSFAKNQNPFMATPTPTYFPFMTPEPTPVYNPSPLFYRPPYLFLEPTHSSSDESLPRDPSKGKAPMKPEPPPQQMVSCSVIQSVAPQAPSFDESEFEESLSTIDSESESQVTDITALLMADPLRLESSHIGQTETIELPPPQPTPFDPHVLHPEEDEPDELSFAPPNTQ